MTLRARLAFYGAGVVALAVLLFGALFSVLVAFGQGTQRDALLEQEGRRTVAAIASVPASTLAAQSSPGAADLAHSANTFVEILDQLGNPLSTTGAIAGSPVSVPANVLQRATSSTGIFATIHPTGAVALRVYVLPWARPDLGLSGFAVAGQPQRVLESTLRGLLVFLTVAALLSLLAALAVNWFVPGRALRPLKLMAQAADRIGDAADLRVRLPPARSHDEVGALTASFNRMLGRLERAQRRLAEANARLETALTAQRRFVADASHELRTPLTSIRNNAGFLLHEADVRIADRTEALTDIAAESERMSRLVEDLLTLARADAGHPVEMAPIDLSAIAAAVCRRAETAYPSRRFYLDAAPSAPMMGNEDALTQLIWIMLDNAAKHSGDGGQIWLGVSDRSGCRELRVADDGAGIPVPDLDRIFERFYQVDPARSGGGAGLGLAIAAAIVQVHDGRIRASNNASSGATFSVEFPSSSSSKS